MDLTGARLGSRRWSVPVPVRQVVDITAEAGPDRPGATAAEPGWRVRVAMRSRRGRPFLTYEGLLT
jgi:hypothetical protein